MERTSWDSTKKSLLITLRIFFVLFTLKFIKDAFYNWDGYSYYMRFIDFLPDLSLAFILWTVFGLIFTFTFWLITYGLTKIIPKTFRKIRYEHIIIWLTFAAVIVFIKRNIFNISFSELLGLDHSLILVIAAVLAITFILSVNKYINYEKMLIEVNARIAPLLWLFVFLLILAVPFSLIKKGPVHLISPDHSSAEVEQEETVSGKFTGKKRPNFIMVVMDTLSARDMQLYGYNRPTTPFISEWAKDAFVFNRTYSTSNWTTPATMSIMTGQRPWTHRIWYQVERNPVRNYRDNLPIILKNNGYTIYGFVQNKHAHPENLGISDAFVIKDKVHNFWINRDWWDDKYAKFHLNNTIIAEWIFENNPLVKLLNLKLFRHPIFTSLIRSETVYNRFFEVVSQKPEQPFFAYIHVYPPHLPYLPPAPYMGMFGDEDKYNTIEKQVNSYFIDTYYPPQKQKEVDIFRKRYDEFILYSDQQFKALLMRLSETVNMSDTIIIFLSDHGESFSHGFVGHSHIELYEPLVHIPLVIKIPWRKEGQTIDMPVEQIDIAPTILEFADIPVPEWMEGRSLLPVLEGKTLEPRPIFSMQLFKNRTIGNPPITKGTIAVWDGDYKLIQYTEDNKFLLFDLSSDPDETNNISKEKSEILHRLKKLIEDGLSNANRRITQSSVK